MRLVRIYEAGGTFPSEGAVVVGGVSLCGALRFAEPTLGDEEDDESILSIDLTVTTYAEQALER